jgi:hypothetical protein
LLEIKKKLKKLPKPDRVKTYTGPEALAALAAEIKDLSNNGYNPKEIAVILKQEGVSASAAKVKRILAGAPSAEKKSAGNGGDDEAGPAAPAAPAGNGSESGTPPVIASRAAKPKNNGKEARL